MKITIVEVLLKIEFMVVLIIKSKKIIINSEKLIINSATFHYVLCRAKKVNENE